MGVYFVLCCFDVVFGKGEGVCIRVHVYYMGCAVKCDYIVGQLDPRFGRQVYTRR